LPAGKILSFTTGKWAVVDGKVIRTVGSSTLIGG
jgi:hypothetical protein